MLFTGWEVRIGRNCGRGLTASGGTQTDVYFILETVTARMRMAVNPPL